VDADLRSIQDARDAVAEAAGARAALAKLDQAATDAIVEAMGRAASRHAQPLARHAVEETGCGRYESKVQKNRFCAEEHVAFLRTQRTVGLLARDDERRVYEMAEPVGVVAAIIPMTNPTSTTIFKALIALKARNPIVFSPHPRAVGCITETAAILRDAAIGAGAPRGAIRWMGSPTLEGTQALMRHPDVGIILATGGPGLVRAAYGSGKPAFGVGPGNVPAFVHRSADPDAAARTIVASQRFDNSLVCASEQSLVLDAPIRDACLAAFERHGAWWCDEEQTRALERLVARDGRLNTAIVGKDPWWLAEQAGFRVPRETTVLLAPATGVGPEHPLSIEKLAPILAVYTVRDWREACERCHEILAFEGMGHTLALHARDEEVIWEFFRVKPAYRVLVNAPSSQGAVGFATALEPSMTLGCGAAGNNSTSDNITARHLINVKRLAWVSPGFAESIAAAGTTAGSEGRAASAGTAATPPEPGPGPKPGSGPQRGPASDAHRASEPPVAPGLDSRSTAITPPLRLPDHDFRRSGTSSGGY